MQIGLPLPPVSSKVRAFGNEQRKPSLLVISAIYRQVRSCRPGNPVLVSQADLLEVSNL